MLSPNALDIINCISAMHLQEQKTPRCYNYFQQTTVVDEFCRTAMLNWLIQLSDALALNRETVGLAMSFLDRFLSSESKSAAQALGDRQRFQLAAITSYYTAVKINEPVELGVDMVVKLCRSFYEKSAILAMEKDILYSLQWRLSLPTPLDFMRQILELLPSTERSIVANAQKHLSNATSDVYFSTFQPSVVGAACVAMSFQELDVRASSQQTMFWNQICHELELSASKDFLDVQQRLQSKLPHSKQLVGQPVTTLSRKSSHVHLSDASSPVSVNVKM